MPEEDIIHGSEHICTYMLHKYENAPIMNDVFSGCFVKLAFDEVRLVETINPFEPGIIVYNSNDDLASSFTVPNVYRIRSDGMLVSTEDKNSGYTFQIKTTVENVLEIPDSSTTTQQGINSHDFYTTEFTMSTNTLSVISATYTEDGSVYPLHDITVNIASVRMQVPIPVYWDYLSHYQFLHITIPTNFHMRVRINDRNNQTNTESMVVVAKPTDEKQVLYGFVHHDVQDQHRKLNETVTCIISDVWFDMAKLPSALYTVRLLTMEAGTTETETTIHSRQYNTIDSYDKNRKLIHTGDIKRVRSLPMANKFNGFQLTFMFDTASVSGHVRIINDQDEVVWQVKDNNDGECIIDTLGKCHMIQPNHYRFEHVDASGNVVGSIDGLYSHGLQLLQW